MKKSKAAKSPDSIQFRGKEYIKLNATTRVAGKLCAPHVFYVRADAFTITAIAERDADSPEHLDIRYSVNTGIGGFIHLDTATLKLNETLGVYSTADHKRIFDVLKQTGRNNLSVTASLPYNFRASKALRSKLVAALTAHAQTAQAAFMQASQVTAAALKELETLSRT